MNPQVFVLFLKISPVRLKSFFKMRPSGVSTITTMAIGASVDAQRKRSMPNNSEDEAVLSTRAESNVPKTFEAISSVGNMYDDHTLT